MTFTQEQLDRLVRDLHLNELPIIALYDAAPSEAFAPLTEAKGRACCFAYYPRWKKGETLVIRKEENGNLMNSKQGCGGMQKAFGLSPGYAPWMANFLTDGENGAPLGEGLKVTPELAQEWLDSIEMISPSGDTVLLGPLRIEQWQYVRSITFFVDPDRLAGVMTLATYWSASHDEVIGSFGSGCGLMWRDLKPNGRDHVMLGSTDLAMRKYLPPDILSLSVSPKRFEKMVNVPEGSFLERSWWKDLMKRRGY